MAEESNNVVEAGRERPLAGQRLAEARRMRNISLQDIANELHLDLPRVTALEQNRFDLLGAAVFVKGYLRKYAEVVGLSPEDVLADYRHFDRGDETPPIVGLRPLPPRELSLGPWLVGLLVLAVVTGGAWAWFSGSLQDLLPADRTTTLAPFATEGSAPPRDAGESPPGIAESPPDIAESAVEPQPEPDTGAPPAETPAEADTGAPPAETPAEPAEEPATDTAPPPVLEAPESVPPPEGQVALEVTFTADCWTEVSDASGERLYFGLGRAGETVSVTGEAPLHVLLGDRENAALTVDGESYPIPPSARRGDTARLTITAD